MLVVHLLLALQQQQLDVSKSIQVKRITPPNFPSHWSKLKQSFDVAKEIRLLLEGDFLSLELEALQNQICIDRAAVLYAIRSRFGQETGRTSQAFTCRFERIWFQ